MGPGTPRVGPRDPARWDPGTPKGGTPGPPKTFSDLIAHAQRGHIVPCVCVCFVLGVLFVALLLPGRRDVF